MVLETAVHHILTPTLAHLGYQYQASERIRDYSGTITDLRHVFQKSLPFGQTVTITLLRRHTQRYEPLDFAYTVRLSRSITDPTFRSPQNQISYFQPQDGIQVALSQVLWFIYCLRVYPASYYWWWPETEGELHQQLDDIGRYLADYALPWIEHPWAAAPLRFPDEHDAIFRSQLEGIVAPPLLRFGYHPGNDPVREPRWPYFTKMLPSGLHAVITFGHALHEYYGRWSFDVWLERKPVPGNEPYTANEPGTLFAGLGEVCVKIYGLPRSPYDAWEYHNEAMLGQQLSLAVAAIVQYGIPWLEDVSARQTHD
jgi:hypothetical protein